MSARPGAGHPSRIPLGWAAVLLALYTVRFGYGYGSGDHDELVPSALALLSEGRLFARDWLVQTVLDGVTVRTAFVGLLAALGHGMPVAAAAALLHVAVWGATAAGVWALAWELSRSRLAAAAGTALALVGTVAFPIGANAVVAALLTPEGVAWALLVPALTLWLRRQPVAAGVCIGAAAWFHLLAAALVGLWLAAATLLRPDRRGRLRPLVGLGLPAVVGALPVLGPVALEQLARQADPAGPAPLAIHAVFRNPWHHLFFSFPVSTQVRFWTLLAAGVGCGVWLARRGRWHHGADTARLLGLALVAFGVGVAWVEVWPLEAVAKLQLFKLAVPVTLGASLAVGAALAEAIPTSFRERASAVWGRAGRVASGAALAGVLALGAMTAAGRGPLASRVEPVVHPATPMGRVETWARTSTPRDALFLVPPTASTFRSYSRRAVVITWNGFVFGDRAMQTWRRRLHAVAPIGPPIRGTHPGALLDHAYASATPACWAQRADAFGADYAVVPDSLRLPYPVAFATDGWQVVRLRPRHGRSSSVSGSTP